MALIELKDVSKKYRRSTTALRHVSVSVNQGEFVYIVRVLLELVNQHLSNYCIVRKNYLVDLSKLENLTWLK